MKIFISLLAIISCSFAKLIGGVSIVVNNEPITLYEIEQFSKKYSVSKNEAINRLIEKKIEESQLKKLGIYVQDYEITQKMEDLARSNGISLRDFEKLIIEDGKDIDSVKEQIKNSLKKEKLYKSIVSKKIKQPDEEELKNYYNRHKELFYVPKEIDLIEYTSTSRRALETLVKSPLSKIDGIKTTPKVVPTSSMHPNLLFVLKNIKEGSFSPIMSANNEYALLFIKKKIDKKLLPFESAKQDVFARVMNEKEKAIMAEYFSKLKATANIEVVRKP